MSLFACVTLPGMWADVPSYFIIQSNARNTAMALPSCSYVGALLHDRMHHAGGSVVCTGVGSIASFTNVKFHACTLVVHDGAQVTLRTPLFADMVAAAASLSIFVHGEGTTVHVERGSIEGGTQGVAVQAGARLEASGLDVTKMNLTGLHVKGKGSHLSLTACKVHDLLPCPLEDYLSDGVLVQAGGSAQLKNCYMSACGSGVIARHEGSRLEADGCTFEKLSLIHI